MKRGEQTLVFIPMIHVAPPDYYAKVKVIVDSLRKENYTIFYEEISHDKKFLLPSLEHDKERIIVEKKFRKLMGGYYKGDLTDEKNNSLPRAMKKKKYVSQTKENVGIDSEKDINADVTLSQMIQAHEKKYGEIVLDECDISTDLLAKYTCENLKNNNYYATRELRDSVATAIVLNANEPKSVLIYGRAHWFMMWARFRDAGYIIVED